MRRYYGYVQSILIILAEEEEMEGGITKAKEVKKIEKIIIERGFVW